MYKYEGSFVQRQAASSQVESPNLEFAPVVQIYLDYYRAFLVLSHPSSPEPLYVNMEDVRRQLAAFSGTVVEWLLINGDNTIPTVPASSLPNPKHRSASYIELTRGGYQVNPAQAGVFYPADVNDRDNQVDLSVVRKDSNMELINDKVLFTVNGFIHDSVALESTAYIRNGMKSATIANVHTAGMISFADIGTLKRIPLKAENIKPFQEGTSLKEKMRITVPEYEPGKAYFLVLGGYLIFAQPNRFFQVDEKTFALDINSFDFVERILESSNFIDMRPLELTQPNNMSQPGIYVDELLSNDVLLRYLTLSQTFFVQLSVDNIHVKRAVSMHEPYPGRYLRVQEPVEPLMGAHGRLIEYWPIKGTASWILDVNDNFRRDYIYSERGQKQWKLVDHTEDVTHAKRVSGAYLLDIHSFIQ